MRKVTIAIVLLLCGLGLSTWALPPSDSPGTNACAQDATGTVWALTGDNGRYGALQRWQAGTGTAKTGGWIIEAVPGADDFQPRCLTRGDDGSVYTFWQTRDQGQPQSVQCLVTVHRGLTSRILARFSGSGLHGLGFPNVPTIYAGSGGDVWIPGRQALFSFASPDGSLTPFPLKPDEFFGGKVPELYDSHTISSLTDGQGRRWFWQSETNNWQPNSLRGVLIWNGKTLDYHPTLAGLPDRPLGAVAPLDRTHFWVATAGDYFSPHSVIHGALYRVDTRTLSAVPETPPQPGAFQNIVQIFRADGDWYVVEEGVPDAVATLWRERAGQWRKCLNSLEKIWGNGGTDRRRPWLAEPSGVWLGAGDGAWWLPRVDQAATRVNWRRGLTVLNVRGLFPLVDGHILAVGSRGAAEMPATPQPLLPLPPGLVTDGLGAPKSLGALLADPRQHLWGTHTSYRESSPLDEWDGRHWRTHLPPATMTGVSNLYACDTLGRIWLATSNWHPPAQPQPVEGRAVYDPARDTWTNYATVQEALQAAAALPAMAFRPYRNVYQPPLFSGDGRVTYAYNTTIFLYDGHAWRHWEAHDILPGYSYGNLGGSPHFNAKGHLEVALAEGGPKNPLWDWAPETGWQRAGEQHSDPYENPVPPNGPHGLQVNPVVDSLGEKWFSWHGAIFTAWHGLWATQSELSGRGSPFRDGRGLEDVLRDPEGRLFFVTRPASDYDFVVWSPPPVPPPILSLLPTADDSVTVRIRANVHGSHWLLWRLNGGAWSAPRSTDTVALTALPHGDYRVEVQTLDRRLQPSPPSVAVFSVRVAPATQIARWVRSLLDGTDNEREAAVAGLVKQPDVALPALTAARPGASGAGRWWVDAAIQQVTEQTRAAESVAR